VKSPLVVGALSHVNWKRCRQFFDPGHTGSSSIRRIETNRLMFTWSGRNPRLSLGSIQYVWSGAVALGAQSFRRMEALIVENGAFLVRSWHEYFGN
jgi:hypothetical protein